MRCRAAIVLLVLALAAAACETGSGRSTGGAAGSSRPSPPPVYVSLGGDETFGATLTQAGRLRQVWPQVLYHRALPEDAIFYNLAQAGGLTVDAMPAVLQLFDELKPTLATLWLDSAWLGTTDEAQLTELVRHLRRHGATRVLVAATNDAATNDIVARVAVAEGATAVEVAGPPVTPADHRAVAAAFANALRGARR